MEFSGIHLPKGEAISWEVDKISVTKTSQNIAHWKLQPDFPGFNGAGNDLLPDSTKSLPEPVLIYKPSKVFCGIHLKETFTC